MFCFFALIVNVGTQFPSELATAISKIVPKTWVRVKTSFDREKTLFDREKTSFQNLGFRSASS